MDMTRPQIWQHANTDSCCAVGLGIKHPQCPESTNVNVQFRAQPPGESEEEQNVGDRCRMSGRASHVPGCT